MSVPSLDELLRDPAQVHQLSRQERGELLVRAAAVVACLAASEVAEPLGSDSEPSAPVHLMNAKEVATRLGVKASWISSEARRKNGLPKIQIGRYTRFDLQAVRDYLGKRNA